MTRATALVGAVMLIRATCLCALQAGQQDQLARTTEHYAVVTDVSPAFTELVARHMEGIFREYSRRFQGYGKITERFNVAVYKTAAEYERHVPKEVKGSAGVFVADKQLLAAHAEGRTTEHVLRTLYHEGFHQFMWTVISKDCPIWLNEGLAEYFYAATWNGRGFTVGQVPTDRVLVLRRAVRNGGHVPFTQLFDMSDEQWLANLRENRQAASVQYAQSWSIVHFLLHARNGRYGHLLARFLDDLKANGGKDEVFRRIFGEDIAAFEGAWRDYVGTLEPSAKFRCRDNMVSLMLLAESIYREPRRFKSLKSLRRAIAGGRSPWRLVLPSGETISSNDRAGVAALFRCPVGNGSQEPGLILITDPRTGLPLLVSLAYSGIIIKAYYVPQPDGRYRVEAEEIVRDTVPQELRRAILAAGRR